MAFDGLTCPSESMASPSRSRTMSPAHSGDSDATASPQTEITPGTSNELDSEAIALPQVEAEDSSSQPKQPRLCNICGKHGRYKCARLQCPVMYCSVGCSRVHHADHPPDPEVPLEAATSDPEKAKITQQHDPYQILLDHRADFQILFYKYPNLKRDLIDIQRATESPAKSQDGGQSISSSRRRQQLPWSRDEGLRNGVAALQAARMDPGEKGDGVHEYCELVVHLLSKPAGSQLATSVQQEVLAEETKTIKRLMEQEKEVD